MAEAESNDDYGQTRENNRIPYEERGQHKKIHGYFGQKHRSPYLPIFMTWAASTPPITVAMWTSLCTFYATCGWLATSLLGYNLCRAWKNPPPAGEGLNLEFIFNAYPLNRWAVNVATSFFVTIMLFLQTLWLICYKYALKRRDLKKFANEKGWMPPEIPEDTGTGPAAAVSRANPLCALSS